MSLPTSFRLNTGADIPAVGFGTWQAKPHEVEVAVALALQAGYRHIDCAAIYRNEAEVGAGIRAGGVPREDIFITGKLWNTKHRPEDVEAALDKTLKDLGTDYVDLAFEPSDRWFPLDADGVFELADIDPAVTYAAMEKLLATGKTRAIGVCNFNRRRLDRLLSKATVVPAVNQIEAHPYLQQPALLDYCRARGIVVEAYSPLGNNQQGLPRAVDDPGVHALASRVPDGDNAGGLDPGLLLYSWGVQRGTVVLPKSVTPARIASNRQVRALPADIFAGISALERHQRFNGQALWGSDIFDELGEAQAKEAARKAGPENLVKFTV